MEQSLDSVCDEFNHWRSTKTKHGRIPNNLWLKAIQLLDRYSMSELSRALRVSHDQIRAKLNLKNNLTAEEPMPFVEIAVPSIKHEKTDITLGSRIELKRSDGASMVIEHLSEQTLSNLLAKFMRDL
jgi:hypothetical protein